MACVSRVVVVRYSSVFRTTAATSTDRLCGCVVVWWQQSSTVPDEPVNSGRMETAASVRIQHRLAWAREARRTKGNALVCCLPVFKALTIF